MDKQNVTPSKEQINEILKKIRAKIKHNSLFFKALKRLLQMSKVDLINFISQRHKKMPKDLSHILTKEIKETEEFLVEERFLHSNEVKLSLYDSFRNKVLDFMQERSVKVGKDSILDKYRSWNSLYEIEEGSQIGREPFNVSEFLPILWELFLENKNWQETSWKSEEEKQKAKEELLLETTGAPTSFFVKLEDGVTIVVVRVSYRGSSWYLAADDLYSDDRQVTGSYFVFSHDGELD